MTLEHILEEIKKAKKIVILTHENPDGDAIGSSLGMYIALKEMGKEPDIIIPELPRVYNFLPEIENVKKALEGTDVENIKTATEKLTTAFYAVSEKLYSQAAAQNQGTEGTKPEGEPKVDENGNVYDADYKVENENNGDNKQD